MKSAWLWSSLLLLVALSGCHLPAEPNPNDPNDVSATRQPFVIKAYLKQLSDRLQEEVDQNHITDAERVKYTTDEAKAFMDSIHFKQTPPNLQGVVAQGFIAAHEWTQAKSRLEIALSADRDPASLSNDQLRYARCLANLGDVDGAISYARKAFAAPPEKKWGILYAVYLEIVPAAVASKPDKVLELAQLVEDAIGQHKLAKRDPKLQGDDELQTENGYVVTRAYHVAQAWKLVIELYTNAHRADLAAKAQILMKADARLFNRG